MSGAVLGLPFFVYDTSVGWTVPAGGEGTWTLDVPMDDLAGQATGLLPVEVALRGEDRETVVSVSGVADVRGSIVSTYGLFGSGVAVVTAILWAAVLLALARHRLPVNRWRRALRFVPAGAGFGLVVIVSLSALRLTAPTGSSELGFLLGTTAVAFLLGYLTPTPRDWVPEPPTPAMPLPGPDPAPGTGPRPTYPQSYSPRPATSSSPPPRPANSSSPPPRPATSSSPPSGSGSDTDDIDPDTIDVPYEQLR